MKALVLGAGGMAGHVVSLHLREKGHDIDTLSANHPLDAKTTLLDVTNTARLKQFLDAHDYEAVINCIALLVKPSEEHKDLAVLLNAHLPHFLEAYYKDTKTKVVHLSSDGVFSNEHSPYKEDALYDGQ